MRVLIITQKVDETDDVLGFFTSWIAAIAKRSDQVYVICLAKGHYSLPENVTVASLGKERGASKLMQALRFYHYALRFMWRADGVFIHMAPEYVRALYPLNVLFKKPVVMWYAHIKVSPVAKWAIDHVDKILTPSKDSFSIDSDKVVATGHGINTEIFSPIKTATAADVVAISRISKVKRLETLVEAARILKERGKEASIDIYGKAARAEDGGYLAMLKEKTAVYGLGGVIAWRGAVANREAPEVYASHKVFVRMQGGGGFGKTELEAMSMGIPAIVPTDVYKPYLGDFASDTYFPEDDAAALADRIERVLAWSEERRAKYAALARKLVVERHNVENVAEALINNLRACAA
jgi:glycosyltransferase involved in cell wall biosynthesis